MAKRVNSASLKGYLHNNLIVEEFGKKEEDPSQFYDLSELLEEFKGKMVTISIKEEQPLPSVDDAETEDEELEDEE